MKNGDIASQGRVRDASKFRKWIHENKIIVILLSCVIIAVIVGLLLIIAFSFLLVDKERSFRLPTNLIPSHYSLEVKPYLIPGNFKFEGKVEITVTCVQTTDVIVLHSSGLEISEDNVKVWNVNTKEILKVIRIKHDIKNKFLILQLLEHLKQAGSYRIFISYGGTMGEEGVGFYVSSYEDSNGNIHYTASTQFEAFNAREAFPCFDEPAMKAKFDITVVRWKNMTSLSNMNKIKSEARGDDWEADIYRTTLKMSTYLVAFFVGEYVGKSKDKIAIWSHPDETNLTDFALESSQNILRFFEDRLQPYWPPKLDFVPVIKLNSRAMENWGLIIVRRDYLLYNESDDDVRKVTKQDIASLIAHEIAHQWFGNLVTPKWWSDIWLSEGITTYMEHIASRALYSEWYQLDKTVTSMYSITIGQDCRIHSAIHKNITRETKDSDIFDMFVYKKGAAIIHMAHEILGNHIFWKGLSEYLEKHAYGNVEEKDLWECLTKAQDINDYKSNQTDDVQLFDPSQNSTEYKINLTEVMTSWTHLGGLPVVTVDRDYNMRTATFSQESCNPSNDEQFKNDIWQVPISFTTNQTRAWNAGMSLWLKDRSTTVNEMPSEKEWLLVKGMGYYIVNYDRTNWNLLAAQLFRNHHVFPAENRFKLLADANLLESMGHLTIDTLLDLSLFFPKETKLYVLTYHNLMFIWNNMNLMEESYYHHQLWKEYLLYLFEPTYKMVFREDNDNELPMPPALPTLLMGVLCNVNYTPCFNKSMDVYYSWKSSVGNDTKYSDMNTEILLCSAIKYGQKSDWEYMYNHYIETDDSDLLAHLACSRDANQIKQLLWLIFEKNKGAYMRPLYTLMRSTHWREILVYFEKHFSEIASNDDVFKDVIHIFEADDTPFKYEQVLATCKKFLRTLSGSQAESLKTVLDEMEEKLPRLEKKKALVENWLERKPWRKQYDS